MTPPSRANILLSFEKAQENIRIIAFERDDEFRAWQVIDILEDAPDTFDQVKLHNLFCRVKHLAEVGEHYDGDGKIWIRQTDGTHRILTPNEEVNEDIIIPRKETDEPHILFGEKAQLFDHLRSLIQEAVGTAG